MFQSLSVTVLSQSSIFGAKSKNRVSEIQRLTDCQTLEKATLRQNHLARQHRTGIPLEALPNQICEATLEARAYVLVRHGLRTLAGYRVKPDGYVSRLKRWPKALDRCRA